MFGLSWAVCVLSLQVNSWLLPHPLGLDRTFKGLSLRKHSLNALTYTHSLYIIFRLKLQTVSVSLIAFWLPPLLISSTLLPFFPRQAFSPEPRGQANRQWQSLIIASLNYEDERVNGGSCHLPPGSVASGAPEGRAAGQTIEHLHSQQVSSQAEPPFVIVTQSFVSLTVEFSRDEIWAGSRCLVDTARQEWVQQHS